MLITVLQIPVADKRSLIIWLFALMLLAGTVQAEPIPISRVDNSAIGQYAEIFFEPGERLSIDEVRRLFDDRGGVHLDSSILNFGLGAAPLWLRFTVDNPTDETINKVFSVETAWLDKLSIHIFQDDKAQLKYALGDSLVQTDRPVDSRFYVVEYAFKPGVTSLYLRVAGTDPMLLPIYLSDINTFNKRFEIEDYSYGLLYGVLAALLLYNLMLFFSLRSAPHLLYSLYLLSFIACNFAYTGHGFRWLWPHATHWQQWSNPVLMIVAGICGLLFATSFLQTRKTLPRLHWGVWGICLTILMGLGAAYYVEQIQTALVLAFVFIILFTCLMALMGLLAYRAGNPSARFFLPASVVAAMGAMITTLTVWNVLPYTVWTYRAVDIGIVIESILLALALADQFRRGEAKRLFAEEQARTDPLTGLNNRRAFQEQVKRLWQQCHRQKQPMAVVIVDLDNFKQINDTHGHQIGDQVLEATARQLQDALRNGDVLARWGGEEFILFMPDTTVEAAVHVAERIRQRIESICQDFADNQPMALSASLGVADSRSGSGSLEKLIQEADKCLYSAKQMGRNQVATMAFSAA